MFLIRAQYNISTAVSVYSDVFFPQLNGTLCQDNQILIVCTTCRKIGRINVSAKKNVFKKGPNLFLHNG